ncbi:MAG: protease SohB [Deltaproteobacteria bacterium]|nr:MAG: protease SohB [Deltaproteobacteria bacterium]
MEFWPELGLFVVKAVIVVVALGAIIGLVARAAARGGGGHEGRDRLVVKRLNERYRRMAQAVRGALLPKHAARAALKDDKKQAKAERKAKGAALAARVAKPRVFVVDFDGNVRASAVTHLRAEITAILAVARPGDEVVVRIKSPGGLVHAYGLAASQLERVKAAGVQLTAVVDLVAASGGYMMACVADRILAAPFAVVGSIGVVAGIPNLNRLLKRHDVDYELLTAGEYKRTLTVFGENTEAGRKKLQEELDLTHALFKAWVGRHRPAVDLTKVATGEHWYGTQALELGLVDAVGTSDDYLMAKLDEAELVSVAHKIHRPLVERLSRAAAATVDRGLDRVAQRAIESRFP